MSKKNEAWEAFLAKLSKPARAAMSATENPLVPSQPQPEPDDDGEMFQRFLAKLSPTARAAYGGKAPEPKPTAGVEEASPRWGIVEATDGEWAKMRLFKTADALARRVQELEGTDTVVWCFYGLPMPVSKGPQRYLTMPGGKQLMQVPLYEGGPCKLVDADLLPNLEAEEAGYVGPRELSEAAPQAKEQIPVTAGPDDDDDEV